MDPGIASMLDELAAMDVRPIHEGTPEAARRYFRRITAGMPSAGRRESAPVIPVGSVRELTIPSPGGHVVARAYWPEVDGLLPTVLYCHGGGFVIGDVDAYDNQARRLCRAAGAVVVDVDYRLAPEHPWPAALSDVTSSVRWLAENIQDFGADPRRLAVAGDSAGGNLAAVVTQACRDAGGPHLAAQLLIYPAVDLAADANSYASRKAYKDGYLLTMETMAWFARLYVRHPEDLADIRVSPARGHLGGLPPAVVATAEFDPLRDEGEQYAARLQRAGVATTLVRCEGVIHGFFDLADVSDACADAADVTCAEFAKLLLPGRI